MYIDAVPNRNSPPAILLRESYREEGKTKKRTLCNLSKLPPETIEAIRASISGEMVHADATLANPGRQMKLLDARQHGHVAAIVGMIKKSGLLKTIDRKDSRRRDIVAAMIADRLISGDSKLATARHCRAETAATSLGDILGLTDLDEHECYEAMDWLTERQESIQKKLARKHLPEGEPVLFDLSSSYFEGHCCPLAKHGYSRDKRGDLPQVNYGMYCNSDGVPIGVEVLAGNENDRLAFDKAVDRVQNDFGLKNVIFIGDRGMISGRAIDEHLRGNPDAHWITALTGRSVKSLLNKGAIQRSFFDEKDLVEIVHADYPGERLVVCRNPLLEDERRRKREALLAATEKKLALVKKKVDRTRNPIRGEDTIGVEVGKVIDSKKVAKHFDLVITDDSFRYARNQERIDAESAMDGLYVIRTDVDSDAMSKEKVVAHYKNLAKVERAFRSMKSIDIHVRPIFHYLEHRVRVHIFICMLAYYIEFQMRRLLAPLMFIDEEKQSFLDRDAIVSPSERSDSAREKDATKRNAQGRPTSSFRDILTSLSSLMRTRVRIEIPIRPKKYEETFYKTSEPSEYQKEIIRLLGIGRYL